MLDFLVQFFTDYGYFAVFGILILCGFGLPVPEDITLVSGGVISGLGYTNVHVMCFIGLAGVLIGDSTMFLAGRLFGYRIQRIRLFRRILSPRRFSQIQRKFKQYGLGLLFVARFLPGLRSPIYLVSGMSRRVSFITFILMDGCAALISVPVWIYLGYFFADNLDLLMEYVGDVQKAIYLALGVLVLVILVIYLKKRFHSKLNAIAGEDGHSTKATTSTTKIATTSSASTISASATSIASTASSTVASTTNVASNVNSNEAKDNVDSKTDGTNVSEATSHATINAAGNDAALNTNSQDVAAKTANLSEQGTLSGANLTKASQSEPCPCQTGSTASVPMSDSLASVATPNTNNGINGSNGLNGTNGSTVTLDPVTETHEEILSKRIKSKTLISKLSKASSLAASGKGHSQFNPGVGSKS